MLLPHLVILYSELRTSPHPPHLRIWPQPHGLCLLLTSPWVNHSPDLSPQSPDVSTVVAARSELLNLGGANPSLPLPHPNSPARKRVSQQAQPLPGDSLGRNGPEDPTNLLGLLQKVTAVQSYAHGSVAQLPQG